MERALIVSASKNITDTVGRLLRNSGFTEISAVASGNEARRAVDAKDFSLVVINTPLPDEFGHELSVMVTEVSAAGVMLLCRSDIADDISEKVSDLGVFVLRKPVSAVMFTQSLGLVRAARARMLGLRRENTMLRGKIDELRLLSRAKCALIRNLGLTEPEAHRYIEKQAMDRRRTKRETAENILARYPE